RKAMAPVASSSGAMVARGRLCGCPENPLAPGQKAIAIAPLPSGVGQRPGPWAALVMGASTAARSAYLISPEYGEEDRMTTVAAKPGAPVAGEWHRPTALEGVAATGSRT